MKSARREMNDADTYPNAAPELLAGLPQRPTRIFRPWAESAPERPALIGDGKVWTSRPRKIVDDAATALRRHGVRPGDRVMVVSQNSLALAALIRAVSAIYAWSEVANPTPPDEKSTRSAITAASPRHLHGGGLRARPRPRPSSRGARGGMGRLGTSHIGPRTRPRCRRLSKRTVRARSRRCSTRWARPAIPRRDAHASQHPVQHQHFVFGSPTDGGRRDYGALPMLHIVVFSIILAGTRSAAAPPIWFEDDPAAFCDCCSRHHLPAVRRAHDLSAPAGLQGRGP